MYNDLMVIKKQLSLGRDFSISGNFINDAQVT